MHIKVTITHDDGSVQEYDGPAFLDQIEEEEAEYVVTIKNPKGSGKWDLLVQAPATQAQLDHEDWLAEQE